MVTGQEPLPTTPSVTELVSLMGQLQIASSVDPVWDVPDKCDSELHDDCDGEYDLYPQLQSFLEQVLLLIELLA